MSHTILFHVNEILKSSKTILTESRPVVEAGSEGRGLPAQRNELERWTCLSWIKHDGGYIIICICQYEKHLKWVNFILCTL